MPVSRRRPAAARKLAAARKRQTGGGGGGQFIDAPWLTWQRLREDPAAPAEALAVLEHTPFWVDWGDRITSSSLAGLSRTLEVRVADISYVAERGYLSWERETGTVIPCIPAGSS